MSSYGPRTGLPYQVGMALEPSPGVYTAPTKYIKYVTAPWDEGVAEQSVPVHDGTRTAGLMVRQEAVPQMPLAIPCWPENGLEQLLFGALGNKGVSAGLGSAPLAYLHTMQVTQGSPATQLPTYTFTQWANGIAGEQAMVHTGCMVSDLQLSANGPGVVNLAATIVGNPLDLTHAPPTATYNASNPFTFDQMVVQVDSIATPMSSFTMDINNNIGQGLNLSDGTLLNTCRAPGELDISGQIAYPFKDQGDLQKYLGGLVTSQTLTNVLADHTLNLTFTGPVINTTYNYLLTFSLPHVKLTKPTINFDDSGNPVQYGFTYTVLPDAGGNVITATVQSKLTSIT
jgi:hypothetical protein